MIRILLLALIAIGLLTGCQPNSPKSNGATEQTDGSSKSAPKPEPLSTYFPLQVGSQSVDVQLALTPKEQETGLMHRDSMGEFQGMIFVFNNIQPRRFWMRNTYIPLDIAYISPDGVIQEIHAMQPLDESGAPSRSRNIQFALEMNQGWFEAYGVKPGDKIDLQQLADAMQARDFEPPFAIPAPAEAASAP